ncbi:hypothetical protein Tco_0637620 [Tanacetum coccineum]
MEKPTVTKRHTSDESRMSKETKLYRKKARVGKVKGKTYNVSPWGPVYEAILKKKITKKEDIEGNFAIPCSIGGPNACEHLRRSRDVLVEVAEHVYPVDFVILDIKEKEKRLFILGTPFLTTVKATIKFDKEPNSKNRERVITSPGMGRKDKSSLGKGNEVQPIGGQIKRTYVADSIAARIDKPTAYNFKTIAVSFLSRYLKVEIPIGVLSFGHLSKERRTLGKPDT